MLTTFKIGPVLGRICYATESGEGKFFTAEFPEDKFAVRFWSEKKLLIGDWIVLRSEAKIEVGSDEDPPTYYHNPHDGSRRADWIFFQVLNSKVQTAPPPNFFAQTHRAMRLLENCLTDWEKCDEEKWKEIAETLGVIESFVKTQAGRLRPALAPSIDTDRL